MHYTVTNEEVANTYLKKLSSALDRNVKVFLIIDALMSNPDKALIKELKRKGAYILFNKKTK